MIVDDSDVDPAEWVNGHPDLIVPGEVVLAPLIHFSRLCRLYADSLASMSAMSAKSPVLDYIENDWQRWRRRWIGQGKEIALVPIRLISRSTRSSARGQPEGL